MFCFFQEKVSSCFLEHWKVSEAALCNAGKDAPTEDGAMSADSAQREPVASPPPVLSGDLSNGWGTSNVSTDGEPTQQQAQAGPQLSEGSSQAPHKAMRSPRSPSFQQQSSTGGPAAQRQGSIRSKSEHGRKGVRRLGAEPLGRASPRLSSSAEAVPAGNVDRGGSNGALGAPSSSKTEQLNETPKSNRSSSRSPRFARTSGQWEEKAHSVPPRARSDEAQQHGTEVK